MTGEKARFSPREQADCLSILLFWWLRKLIKLGLKREICEEDIYPVLYSDHSAILGSKLEKNWIKHLEKCAKKKSKPSFRWVMFLTFGPKFLFYGIFSMLEECVFRIIQVISLGYLIKYFNAEEVKASSRTMAELACGGIVLGSVFFSISFQWSIFNTHHVCTHMRLAMSSLIYRKTLRLSQATMRSFSSGQLITMLSSDVHRFDMQDLHLNYIWVAPIQLTIVIYLLYYHYGFGGSSLGGLILLVVFVLFQLIMSRYIFKVRNDKIIATNRRMRLITEIMNAFYNIKVYAWENLFYASAKESRRHELHHIQKTMLLRILNSSLSLILTKITVFLTLLFYINDNQTLDAERVFITVLLYEHVRVNLAFLFTQGTADFAEISVTCERMTEFLLLEEIYVHPAFYEVLYPDDDVEETLDKPPNGVWLKDVCCKWHYDQENYTLENINLEITEGKMIAVVGPIGSGKSSFLAAILGELPTVAGKITIQGRIAYVSQTPWLFPGTIRQNIIFGTMYDETWHKEVLDICGLKQDIDHMEDGDNTKVIRAALSVGQKARISMARAVYSNAEIYLMDDPLNSMDVRLQRHILDNCIRGALKDKAVILVTHQLHFLEAADDIAIIINGKLRAEGTLKGLQEFGIQFSIEVEGQADDDSSTDEEYDHFGAVSDVFSAAFPQYQLKSKPPAKPKPKVPTSKPKRRSTEKVRRRSFLIIEEEEETHKLIVKEHLDLNRAMPDAENIKMQKIGRSTITLKEIEDDSDKAIIAEKIGFRLFWSYIHSSSSWALIIWLLFVCIVSQAFFTFSELWLEYWTEDEEHRAHGEKEKYSRNTELIVYSCSIPALLIMTLARSFTMFRICINSSLALFVQILNSLLHAKARFLESSCAGHGINRFSKDMIVIDELLPTTLYEISGIFFEILGCIVIICMSNPWAVVPCLVFPVVIVLLYKVYHNTAAALKRLEANSRSPVYAHISKSLEGLSTIRAYEQERIFQKIFDDLQDVHTSTWYLYLSMHAWLSLCVDYTSLLLISTVTVLFLVADSYDWIDRPQPAAVGLAVAKVIELSILMQIGVRELAHAETEMISVERILEYTNEEGEGNWEIPENKPPSNWPEHGHIKFDHVSVRGWGNRIILKDINLEIEPGEKVGVVGRSGSGKSTLINTLFRITEPNHGTILLDDIDVRKIGLHDLRKKLSIIPQVPHIFTGTLRMNMDPFDQYPEREIWKALDEVSLYDTVKALGSGLDTQFTETGWQFSIGQAQLLGLARALLQKNKVLCLDEATANLDPQTQELMLKKIGESFSNCTVIKVAHRLHTVIDVSKIIVIEAGHIVDCGEPYQLIKEQGPLYNLIMHMEKSSADEVIAKAKESYNRRRAARKSINLMTINSVDTKIRTGSSTSLKSAKSGKSGKSGKSKE